MFHSGSPPRGSTITRVRPGRLQLAPVALRTRRRRRGRGAGGGGGGDGGGNGGDWGGGGWEDDEWFRRRHSPVDLALYYIVSWACFAQTLHYVMFGAGGEYEGEQPAAGASRALACLSASLPVAIHKRREGTGPGPRSLPSSASLPSQASRATHAVGAAAARPVPVRGFSTQRLVMEGPLLVC